ncbi:MAG: alpha/beta hydrolase [Actinomycetota bacterium]|nr:alpha/beta hydrolase [Actinomycetota bacterium]
MGPDPSVFDESAVDAETRCFNAQLEEMLAAERPPWPPPPEALAEARQRGTRGPVVVSDLAEERTIPGPGGLLRLRVFVPPGARGAYLHLHGGGWVIGSARLQDDRLEALALACRVVVVSVDYRLAPEHPYPAAPDDCYAAAEWLVEHGSPELGTQHLLIGGESAGASLAVVTLLRRRDRYGTSGFAAANLAYGLFDLSLTPSARSWGERLPGPCTREIEWVADQFVPPERRREPDVSPLYAHLGGMPPALFSVGTLDPLLDDTLFMHARWKAAGNRAELAVYPGGVHSFDAFPIGLACRANVRAYRFLSSFLEGAPA